jgi:hypothetical protein
LNIRYRVYGAEYLYAAVIARLMAGMVIMVYGVNVIMYLRARVVSRLIIRVAFRIRKTKTNNYNDIKTRQRT